MSLYARGKLKATVKSGRCANWGYWLRLPLPAHAGVDVPKSAYKNDGDNDRGGAHALIAMACCIGGKEREFGSCSRSALLFARRRAASMKLIHTHRQAAMQYASIPVWETISCCCCCRLEPASADDNEAQHVHQKMALRKSRLYEKENLGKSAKRVSGAKTQQMSNQKRRENKDENGDWA